MSSGGYWSSANTRACRIDRHHFPAAPQFYDTENFGLEASLFFFFINPSRKCDASGDFEFAETRNFCSFPMLHFFLALHAESMEQQHGMI